jgi:hypothetical protein
MGLYDRDYMRKERKPSEEVQHSKLPDPENANIYGSLFRYSLAFITPLVAL